MILYVHLLDCWIIYECMQVEYHAFQYFHFKFVYKRNKVTQWFVSCNKNQNIYTWILNQSWIKCIYKGWSEFKVMSHFYFKNCQRSVSITNKKFSTTNAIHICNTLYIDFFNAHCLAPMTRKVATPCVANFICFTPKLNQHREVHPSHSKGETNQLWE